MLRRALSVTGRELTSMVLESERRVWLTSVGGVVSVVGSGEGPVLSEPLKKSSPEMSRSEAKYSFELSALSLTSMESSVQIVCGENSLRSK